MGYPMLEYPPEVSASSTVPSGGGGDYLFAYKGSKQCALYALQNSSRRSSESRRGSSSQALDGAAKSGSAWRRHTVKLVRTRRVEWRTALRRPFDADKGAARKTNY